MSLKTFIHIFMTEFCEYLIIVFVTIIKKTLLTVFSMSGKVFISMKIINV